MNSVTTFPVNDSGSLTIEIADDDFHHHDYDRSYRMFHEGRNGKTRSKGIALFFSFYRGIQQVRLIGIHSRGLLSGQISITPEQMDILSREWLEFRHNQKEPN